MIDCGVIDVAWTEKRKPSSHWHAYQLRPAFDEAYVSVLKRRLSKEPFSLGVFALAYGYSALSQQLRVFEETMQSWESAVRRASAVIVCPGRTLTALALATLANYFGTKNYELQAGTISKTGRFVAPITSRIFVNDTFSEEVYSEYLGIEKDRLQLVGSPRLDAALASAREASAHEAMISAYGAGGFSIERPIVFATQPLELNICETLFRTMIKSVSECQRPLVIRLHPTEGRAHIALYRKILDDEKFPSARLLPSTYDAFELKAAHAVVTYYSTIGLEGLALGQRVICITPSEHAARPFDLVALGAEGPIWNHSVLAKTLVSEKFALDDFTIRFSAIEWRRN